MPTLIYLLISMYLMQTPLKRSSVSEITLQSRFGVPITKDGPNRFEHDWPRCSKDANASTDNLGQTTASCGGFHGPRLVFCAESAFGGGPGTALALGTKIQARAQIARGWRFGVHWLVGGITRVVWIRRRPEYEIGGGAVPLRPAGGIING